MGIGNTSMYLQALSLFRVNFNLPWKVYVNYHFDFKLLNRNSLDHAFQSVVSEAAKSYGNYQL